MKVRVRIPSVLRGLSEGKAVLEIEVDGEAPTVADVFRSLAGTYVGVRDRTLDEHGALRQHVNVFLNSDSVRDLSGLDTLVHPDDEISIIPAVSGGTHPLEARLTSISQAFSGNPVRRV